MGSSEPHSDDFGLSEALRLIRDRREIRGVPRRVFLACGFEPLHLETFLRAHALRRPALGPLAVERGIFGNLSGNIERAKAAQVDAIAIVVEWSDLDPRLGFRGTGRWTDEPHSAIVASVEARLEWLFGALSAPASKVPIAVALPMLPRPPVFDRPGPAGDPASFEIAGRLAAFAAAAAKAGAKVLDPRHVDRRSPPGRRHDLESELRTSFPYTLGHASILAQRLLDLLFPPALGKGIITDLDDTLWRGVLGEVGVDGVTWRLEDAAHGHALYQQMLASLSRLGVLIGIASKNDPRLVAEVLSRSDLIVPSNAIFPVRAGWGPKSDAVREILEAWNIGAEDVVLVDDSPMDLAEVAAAVPGIGCLEFPKDPRRLPELLEKLRDRFGKTERTAEDTIRVASLRALQDVRSAARRTDLESFLAQTEAEITFTWDGSGPRALELVNKTHQFNLNGRRLDPAEWSRRLADPGRFALRVLYTDKFGPLGEIGVVAGRIAERGVGPARVDPQRAHPGRTDASGIGSEAPPRIDTWVLSCRAFSRRIEHHTLRALFDRLDAASLEVDYMPTERNGPVGEFLRSILGVDPASPCLIDRTRFDVECPRLHARERTR